jgi:hypothetical protein
MPKSHTVISLLIERPLVKIEGYEGAREIGKTDED